MNFNPNKPDDNFLAIDDALSLIDDILQFREYRVSDREREFMESIREQQSRIDFLSEKQTKWLNNIFDRVMK
jgi:hypothetical protein